MLWSYSRSYFESKFSAIVHINGSNTYLSCFFVNSDSVSIFWINRLYFLSVSTNETQSLFVLDLSSQSYDKSSAVMPDGSSPIKQNNYIALGSTNLTYSRLASIEFRSEESGLMEFYTI